MSKSFRKDLTGQRFGRLTVISFVPTEDKNSHWLCKCDCGNEIVRIGTELTRTRSKFKSCGCWFIEISRETARELGKSKHNLRYTRLYKTWRNMKTRCYNSNNHSYGNYGGRGIKMCDEWKDDFQAFSTWAFANGYNDKLTIDRIDNNGNYEPKNCRWVDAKIQNRNTRRNIIVEYQGTKMILIEASEKSGIKYDILIHRYRRGDRGERLFRPVEK